jgi:hypothetical protein
MISFRGLMSVMALICFTVAFLSVPALGGELPQKGDTLTAFELQSPAAEKDRVYLGITKFAFLLKDIRSKLLLLEVIGVYCPVCYRQAPIFNNLYNRIEKSSLKGKVKMLALAAGGNPMEIQALNDQKQYSFPIAPDPSFEVHKLLGEPRTPFTLLLNPDGKVLYAHMGIIEDLDAFWKTITELTR